jgi:hypothetical protein
LRLGTAGTGVIEGRCMAAPASVAAGGGVMMMVKSTAYSTLAGVCVEPVDMGPWPEMAQIFEMNFIISKFRLFARV